MATAGSWKNDPLGASYDVPYRESFSDEEMRLLHFGLIPEAMENKWFIYYSAPSLFVHRSWTGRGVYRVDFSADGRTVERAVAALPDSGKADDPDYDARLLGFLIGNLLLGRNAPFPMPNVAAGRQKGAFQHAVAGTGYREISPEADPK